MVVFLFISCNKREKDISEIRIESENLKLENLHVKNIFDKSINPYDSYGIKMEQVYAEVNNKLSLFNKGDKKSYDEAVRCILNNNTKNFYPAIKTKNYSRLESKLFADFVREVNPENISEISLKYEELVYNNISFSQNEKSQILQIISNLKFSFYYCTVYFAPNFKSWETDFMDCMRSTMEEVFKDDGNPIPEIVFIINIPISLLEKEAECAWYATFG